MKNFRDIRVKYSHPAIPPLGIKLNFVYSVGYLIDNYNLNDKSIKVMFKPTDCKWEDLEKKQDKKNKKEVEVEVEEIVEDYVGV